MVAKNSVMENIYVKKMKKEEVGLKRKTQRAERIWIGRRGRVFEKKEGKKRRKAVYPSSIKLIDSVPDFESELSKFAQGAIWGKKNVTFNIFKEEELLKYREIIAECFTQHASFRKYIDFTFDDYIEYVLPEYEEQSDFLKYSVAAKVDGKLAGVYYSSSWGSRPEHPIYTKPDSKEVWKKFDNFGTILHDSIPFDFRYPDEKGRLPPGALNPNSVLYWSNAGVLPAYQGKNLSYDLMFLSAAVGYLNGLQYAMLVSSDLRSSFINKIGGVSFKPIYLRDFEVDGVRQYPTATENDYVTFCFLNLS